MKGKVWHVGSNLMKKGSFSDEMANSWEPRQITYFEENGYQVSDIAAGFDHSIIVATKKDDPL